MNTEASPQLGECPRCEGSGEYQRFPNRPPMPCAVCGGTGKILEADDLCREELRRAGLPYPRHCQACGLTGPCKRGWPRKLGHSHGMELPQPLPPYNRPKGYA